MLPSPARQEPSGGARGAEKEDAGVAAGARLWLALNANAGASWWRASAAALPGCPLPPTRRCGTVCSRLTRLSPRCVLPATGRRLAFLETRMARSTRETASSRTSRRSRTARDAKSEPCLLPCPPSLDVIKKTSLKRPDREARAVQRYFESQSHGETVRHLEKVTSETVFGRDYDVWDVWTDSERWWVVTGPMNLYRQQDYVSMDYLLSFH